MMRFSTLLKHPADWMISGDADTAVVLTSRIRLARNLCDQAFPGWSTKEKRRRALETLLPAVESLPPMKSSFSRELNSLSSVEKQVLVERHLISREQAARGEGSAAVVDRRQNFSIMLNEEDHLRLQAIRPGLDLSGAFDALAEVDDQLEASLDFAYDPELGYLTACPTNLGTGLRASAMLHLPGLVLSDQISQALSGISKLGLAVRGLFGEGTESLGNLFQISNQSTLGESEVEIVQRLERIVAKLAQHESNARQKLIEEEGDVVADKIGRAYGALKFSHIIDSKEALTHISLLRLGVDLGCFASECKPLCDALLMDIQPAHLQLKAGEKLSPEDRDTLRARTIRERLAEVEEPSCLTD